MNSKMYSYILGFVLKIEAVCMVPAALVSLFNGESRSFFAFLITITLLLAIGIPCTLKQPTNKVIYTMGGLCVAALSWILISIFGALPFMLSNVIPSFVDSVFETVSGFTTTGASILKEVESLPKGILFWRSFTHWIGGMGVLVFMLAITPFSAGSMLNIMRAESPGPSTSKLVPKVKQTAKILYSMYIFMTVLEIVLLVLGGMPLFDSLLNSFGTAGTGGFAIKNESIGAYHNAYFDYVIGIFMMLFGVNFNVYFLILKKQYKRSFHDEELRTYLLIIGAAVLLITLNIHGPVYKTFSQAFRYAFFQVSSIITTTGYATADFNKWPQFSRVILLLLMICGACAGSTGGGIKVSRAIIAFKTSKKGLKRVFHPQSIENVRVDGKTVDNQTVASVSVFLVLYSIIFAASVLIVSLDGFDFGTTFSSVASCLNNIGPGLGVVGPAGNFSTLSVVSKITLTLDMLLGRLEIFPILALFSRFSWKKTHYSRGAFTA